MRKFAALLAATLAAMLAVPKMIFEGGKWVLRAAFAPPTADHHHRRADHLPRPSL